MNITLAGKWEAILKDGEKHIVELPGTLDTNKIGEADQDNLNNRFTRVHVYEGMVRFVRKFKKEQIRNDERVFFEVERARSLKIILNGKEISAYRKGTLSTPYVFEITDDVQEENTIEVLSDNSYEGLPRVGIITSSAATNETQTNWNGLLGYIRLRKEKKVFIDAIRVYPRGRQLAIEIDVDAAIEYGGTIKLSNDVLDIHCEESIVLNAGDRKTIIVQKELQTEDIKYWDEEEGNLYGMTALLEGYEEKTVSFGIRDFGINEKLRLTINHRIFFLRGEANCAVFPETGHPPMEVDKWEELLGIYASYGINCMRFHSWCPPSAAFEAADKMGMMMQPELSHWDWEKAFETEESYAYYKEELKQIVLLLANHPSFVMLAFGNELWAEELGHKRMDELLDMAHEMDDTRLYANASNAHYGQRGTDKKSDFYTSHDYKELHLRGASTENAGHINEKYPNTKTNYDEAVEKVHQEGKPVFSFEVGQFEILPDFKEIEEFHGVTRAVNYEIIRDNVKEKGFLKDWEKWVNATGEISFLAYREEIEAALRTEGISGISLLGLQDFPGQGTALVGMLNSHLRAKPYSFACAKRFKQFFAPVVPLLYLEKYTYQNSEKLIATIHIANYGKESITTEAGWKLCKNKEVIASHTFEKTCYKNEGISYVGEINIRLDTIQESTRFDMMIQVGGFENSYPIWVYPEYPEVIENKWNNNVKFATYLDDTTLMWIESGGSVYLEPKPEKEKIPLSIGGQFTTDFWSVGTFPTQEGGMGMVMDTKHPIFQTFPTEEHTNWQWWIMASGRPIILPKQIKAIVTVPDSYSRLKHMGLLFEAKIGNGKIVVSGMGLRYQQKYPEAKALLHSILTFMETKEFSPKQEIKVGDINEMICR